MGNFKKALYLRWIWKLSDQIKIIELSVSKFLMRFEKFMTVWSLNYDSRLERSLSCFRFLSRLILEIIWWKFFYGKDFGQLFFPGREHLEKTHRKISVYRLIFTPETYLLKFSINVALNFQFNPQKNPIKMLLNKEPPAGQSIAKKIRFFWLDIPLCNSRKLANKLDISL